VPHESSRVKEASDGLNESSETPTRSKDGTQAGVCTGRAVDEGEAADEDGWIDDPLVDDDATLGRVPEDVDELPAVDSTVDVGASETLDSTVEEVIG